MPEFLIDQKQHQNKDMKQGKKNSTFKSQENKQLAKANNLAGSKAPESSHHEATTVLCNTTIFRNGSRHKNTAVLDRDKEGISQE